MGRHRGNKQYEVPSVVVRDLRKEYMGRKALDGVSLTIDQPGVTLIHGPSGSGKTSLLNMMSAIDTPDSGSICINGSFEVTDADKEDRDYFRARTGHIFQRSGLIAGLDVNDNIHTIHDLVGNRIDKGWLDYLLQRLGVESLLKVKANKISGGQAQRVGVVRALAHAPTLIFADEPTASLDIQSAREIHKLLHQVAHNENGGANVIVVSHDETIPPQHVDRIVEMRDGKVIDPDRRFK